MDYRLPDNIGYIMYKLWGQHEVLKCIIKKKENERKGFLSLFAKQTDV